MTIPGKPLVYLDHNVLIYMRDGKFRLSQPLDVQWTYSDEHFQEISRGGGTSVLDVLGELGARQIKLVSFDGQSDQAELDAYSCPKTRYERYLQAINEIPFDLSIFSDFLLRIFGADNCDDIISLPDRLQAQVDRLLIDAGEQGAQLSKEANRVSSELKLVVEKHLSKVMPLRETRRAFGLPDGWGGSPSSNEPINEIWEVIKNRLPGISREQFFLGELIDPNCPTTKSIYLKIVACHTALNLVGYRPDKALGRAKELTAALSDGRHLGYAAYCHLFVTADRRLFAKAKEIYRLMNIQTVAAQLCFTQSKAA